MRQKHKLSVTSYLLFALVFSLSIFALVFLINKKPTSPHKENTTDEPKKVMPTIVLDAGHGGEDGGAVGKNGVFEKDLNLEYTQELQNKLEERGYTVILTRSTDTLLYDKNSDYEGQKKVLDMAERLRIAKQYEDAIFISIHMNSFPQEKYRGLQVYYSGNSSESQTLANLIQNTVKERIQPNNSRHIKSSGGKIFLLDRLSIPSILIECGFLSNQEECELLCTDDYKNKLTDAIILGIDAFFSEYNT